MYYKSEGENKVNVISFVSLFQNEAKFLFSSWFQMKPVQSLNVDNKVNKLACVCVWFFFLLNKVWKQNQKQKIPSEFNLYKDLTFFWSYKDEHKKIHKA